MKERAAEGVPPRRTRGAWIDPDVAYLTWVRTLVPAIGGLSLLALSAVVELDGLRAAGLISMASTAVGVVMLLVARRVGFGRVVRPSIYLDIAFVAVTVAQVDHQATFAIAFLWPVSLAAMLLTPRDTVAVAVLSCGTAIISPLLRGVSDIGVVTFNAVALLAIAFVISALRANEYRANRERRSIDRQLQAAQRIAHLGSYDYDPATDSVTWSDELYRIYGLPPGKALGHTAFIDQIVAGDQERVAGILGRALETQEDADFTTTIVRTDGERRHVRVLGRHVRDEGPLRIVGTIQDITELRRLDELRDEFVAAASHELRTPTSIVLGFASTLGSRWDELSEADRRRFVAEIDAAARRLSLLVEDVLQASQIETGRVHCVCEPFDLADEVRAFTRTWPGGVPVEVEVDPGGLPLVVGDAARTRQVLGNLLDNAARYTPADGEIRVHVVADDGFVAARVEDHGPGIAPEDQQRIFDRFVRLDRDDMGTGLGLYISRRLADAQGGSLTVDSALGRGATFIYALPADRGRVEA